MAGKGTRKRSVRWVGEGWAGQGEPVAPHESLGFCSKQHVETYKGSKKMHGQSALHFKIITLAAKLKIDYRWARRKRVITRRSSE